MRILITTDKHKVKRYVNVDQIIYMMEFFTKDGVFIHSEIHTVLTVAFDTRRMDEIIKIIFAMPAND